MAKALVTLCSATAIFVGSVSVGLAQSSSSPQTPGQKMQDRGSAKGQPGASGYSPGHQMQEKGSKGNAPGASGYAPGHSQDTHNSGSSGMTGGASTGKTKSK
jgi:hypothetical protein